MKNAPRKLNNTIDSLAKQVRQGFQRTDAQIEKLARSVADGFADMDDQFKELKSAFRDAEKRIQALEMKVGGIYKLWEEEKIQRLGVNYLLTRIARLEQKVFEQ